MKNRYIDFVLESGLYNIYRCWRKYDYYYGYVNDCNDYYDDIPLDILVYKDFEYYIHKYPRLIKYCESLYCSHSKKVARVKKRLHYMLSNGPCLFLTLTFTDDVLFNTSQKTRRDYVARFLKNHCNDYVANIDFGEQEGREHYHVLYGCDFIDPFAWSYGTCNIKHIRPDSDKLSTYINKLSYHSVKDSAGSLIYSRTKKK